MVGDSSGRSSRSSSTISSAEDKESDPLAPMSEDAVFNLLEAIHHRLEETGKLRSREFRGPFLGDFLAEKKREEAEKVSVSQQLYRTTASLLS